MGRPADQWRSEAYNKLVFGLYVNLNSFCQINSKHQAAVQVSSISLPPSLHRVLCLTQWLSIISCFFLPPYVSFPIVLVRVNLGFISPQYLKRLWGAFSGKVCILLCAYTSNSCIWTGDFDTVTTLMALQVLVPSFLIFYCMCWQPCKRRFDKFSTTQKYQLKYYKLTFKNP